MRTHQLAPRYIPRNHRTCAYPVALCGTHGGQAGGGSSQPHTQVGAGGPCWAGVALNRTHTAAPVQRHMVLLVDQPKIPTHSKFRKEARIRNCPAKKDTTPKLQLCSILWDCSLRFRQVQGLHEGAGPARCSYSYKPWHHQQAALQVVVRRVAQAEPKTPQVACRSPPAAA